MKTIREVCKIVGVTRRTLQEYDRIGLLSPSNKDSRSSSNDAWLYSDQDIWTLIQIQTLIAAGYEKKQTTHGLLYMVIYEFAISGLSC